MNELSWQDVAIIAMGCLTVLGMTLLMGDFSITIRLPEKKELSKKKKKT